MFMAICYLAFLAVISPLSVDFKGGFDKAQSTLSLSRLSLDGTVDQVALSASYGQYQDIRGTAMHAFHSR